jgi:excisionase family DNA binding protein
MAEDGYYTPPQAARVLGLSRRRVTQMLNEGYLQGERLDNGRWKIPTEAVTTLLNTRTERARPPRSRSSQIKTTLEETKERAALQERRLERLTDSLGRLFDRLERLEDKVRELDEDLTLRS